MLTDRMTRLVAVTISVGLLATTAGTILLLSSEASREYVGLTPRYKVGQRLDTRDFYAAAARTVVLFARSSCGASKASTPQLGAIAKMTAGMKDVQFVVVPTAGWSETERDFIHSIGLTEDNVRPETIDDLKVRVVPTLMVVDRRGRIQYLRESRLSDLNVNEVRTLLSR